MKIAHLTTVDLSLKYLVLPQLEGIVDLGIETIGISAPGPWVPDVESSGVRHVPLAASTRGMNLIADIKAAKQLWRILRKERPDILHTHNPKPGLYGRIVGRLAGVPLVVNTVHGLYATPEDRLAKRAVVYTLEAIASRFSDLEFVQSGEDVETLAKLHITNRRKLRHLGNGVDLIRFNPDVLPPEERTQLRSELGIDDDTIVIGAVGRLVAEKGYPELFRAFARLADHHALICVGPDDPDKADALPREVVRGAEEIGVEFLGMRTDVDRLYGTFDIFVLPSHREGFPRSAMEAAASGLPVIATDIRGCRDVVEDGVNGLLVPVGDAESLADAIESLGRDPQLRTAMGRSSRRKASAEFDENAVVRKVLSGYRDIARQRGLDFPPLPDRHEYTLRDATREDVRAIAAMHSSGIATGFLPSLGPRFMRCLYRGLIGFPDSVLLVADGGNGPLGFVAGVPDTRAFYKHFITHHGLAAGLAALPRAVRPSVLRRIRESLRYEVADAPDAELLAMALIPSARGRGLGTRLGSAFLDRLRKAGVNEARVVVASGNQPAIAAYRRMGFDPHSVVEVHAGERSDVMTWSD